MRHARVPYTTKGRVCDHHQSICLSTLQILADGSYSIGPRQLAESAATARVEHCLVRDSEHRARVVFNLKRLGADNAWRVLNTEVRVAMNVIRNFQYCRMLN